MANYGFKCWDENGNQTFGPGDRIMRLLGTIDVTANGSMSVPLTAGNTLVVQCLSRYYDDYNPPNVTVSGNTISWSYSAFPTPSGTVKSPATILYWEY